MPAVFRRINTRTVFVISLAALLAWALRNAPLKEIWGVLRELEPLALLALVGVNIIILFLLASRWWLILRALGHRIPLPSLLGYRLAAFGISYFTPGPQFGGEPLQVFLLKDRHRLPSGLAISAVTLDKLLELLANFTFLVFGALVILHANLFPDLSPGRLLPVSFGLLALPLSYILLMHKWRKPLSRLLWYLARRNVGPRWLCTIRPAVYHAETHIVRFYRRRPAAFLQALGLSLFIWSLMVFEYWLTTQFLGLHLQPAAVISALTAARLAFLAPSPGGLGALEASQIFVFQALGAGPALALSMVLLIRARDLSLGAFGLWWAGLLTRPIRPSTLISEAGD